MKAKIFLVMIAASVSFSMAAFGVHAGEIEPVFTDKATAWNNGKKIVRFGDTLHVVYMKEYDPGTLQRRVLYEYSTDQGGSWILDRTLNNFSQPSLAVDGNGYPHICVVGYSGVGLKDKQVYHWWKNGGGWNSETVSEKVTSLTVENFFTPSITIGDNTVHIAWRYTSPGAAATDTIQYWNSADGNVETVFGADEGTSPLRYPSIALDNLFSSTPNVPNIVFQDNDAIPIVQIVHYRRTITDTWDFKAYVSAEPSGFVGGITPSLDSDPNGFLHAVWRGASNQNIYHSIYNKDCFTPLWKHFCPSITDPALVRDPDIDARSPSIHSSGDFIVATWREVTPPSDADVYYALYQVGCPPPAEWGGAGSIGILGNADSYPHVSASLIACPPGTPNVRLDFAFTTFDESDFSAWHDSRCITIHCISPQGQEDTEDVKIELLPVPNPFLNSTTIQYTLPARFGPVVRGQGSVVSGEDLTPVKLVIFDPAGRLVKTLVDGRQDPGVYQVEWDGRDLNGEKVPSGIYFYLLKRGSAVSREKIILLR